MPPPKQRLEWIDLFRGLAVVGMIETHACNSFLDAALQQTAAYQELSYWNGLIAPAFFWILGFVRGLPFHGESKPRPAWPAVQRLLVILAIGYAMHLPFGLITAGGLAEPALWRMFMVDVLQCLAVSGLLLVLIERAGRLAIGIALLALLVFVGLADQAQHWRTGFIPLDAYLTSAHGSLFPLFPWAGFALAGFITSRWRADWRLAVVGLLLAVGIRHLPGLNWTSAFFLERLGWVMALAALTCLVVEPLCQRARPVTGWLYLAGRQSLVLYVAHLLLIHAVPLPAWSAEHRIGPTQPPWVVALLFLVLLLASLGAARFNERRQS